MKESIEVLYQFHKALNHNFRSSRELLQEALGLMAKKLNLDQLYFFEWKNKEGTLSLSLAWKDGSCFEVDEEIAVQDSSPLFRMFGSGETYISPTLDYPAIYVPIEWDSVVPGEESGQEKNRQRRRGALRMERKKNSWSFSNKEKELARGFVDELSHNLSHCELDQANRLQLIRADALNELTGIFASSMRVEDGLRLIIQGIQKCFGFDRVRLYLVNHKENKLKGELSADIRGNVRTLSHEEIPLQPGIHKFADIVLGKADASSDKYKEKVIYLPLTVQGKSVGLLIADNLLSQSMISHDDFVSLSSFAGQIALAVDNAMLFEKVQELSQYDELTKLPVRRYFMERLHEEMYRALRFNQPTALIWMDVDHFKEINDTYGHQIGDVALKEVGRVIMSSLRKIDLPCRWGGDEMIILLPQTRLEEARRIAERLSREISEIRVPVPFSKQGEIRITISQGVSSYPEDARSVDDLMQKADEALYWVKAHGRGSYALYGEVIGQSAGKEQDKTGGEQKIPRNPSDNPAKKPVD